MLECIRRFGGERGPAALSAADLGTGRLFLATSDAESVGAFADATFGGLVPEASKTDLLATLGCFFDSMASIRRCALRLGVHENTIRYRLSRIEELTGLVGDPRPGRAARRTAVAARPDASREPRLLGDAGRGRPARPGAERSRRFARWPADRRLRALGDLGLGDRTTPAGARPARPSAVRMVGTKAACARHVKAEAAVEWKLEPSNDPPVASA